MSYFAKRVSQFWICTSLFVLLLVGSAFAADLTTNVGAVTASSLRLRTKPSTNSTILTNLNRYTPVEICETLDGWYRIQYAGQRGYVSADYIILDRDGSFDTYGYTNTDGVNVREGASKESTSLAVLDKETSFSVTGFTDGWYSVRCKYGTVGYIRSDLVELSNYERGGASSSRMVTLARQYLGTPYGYGGASPSRFDCSGFTMYLYKQFGYQLPHSATRQWQSSVGKKVWDKSLLRPGDIVFFRDPSRAGGSACSHCGIYIGDGKFIHAATRREGVIISSLSESYYASHYVGGKQIL